MSDRQRHGEGGTAVLFVCLGNICRSPMAEGVFLSAAAARGFEHKYRADSCGTGSWHVGEEPDPRAVRVAERNGIALDHRARVLDPRRDFERFEVLVAMDRSNLSEIIRRGAPRERTRLMLSFDPASADNDEVPDPHTGGEREFEHVFRLLTRASHGLIDWLEAKGNGEEARK